VRETTDVDDQYARPPRHSPEWREWQKRREQERVEKIRADAAAKTRADLEAGVKRRFIGAGGSPQEWEQRGNELIQQELDRRAAGGDDPATRSQSRLYSDF
jgi:hypothetical protein